MSLINSWQIKNAEEPGKAENLQYEEGRDSYERTDNFNVYGITVYLMLKQLSGYYRQDEKLLSKIKPLQNPLS